MKLGSLVENKQLGLGLVTEELNENCCIVTWFEAPKLSPMVITLDRFPKYPIKNLWSAPNEYGRVFILSEKKD